MTTVQESARGVLASLRARGRANAPAPASGSYRLSRDELAAINALPVPKVRELAQAQFRAAQDAWREATKVPWYYGITTIGVLTEGAGRIRYSAEAKLIDEAKEHLDRAEKETEEAAIRRAYVSAFSFSRIAAGEIAKEAELGSTAYLIFIKMPVERAGEALQGLIPDGMGTVLLVLGGLYVLGSMGGGEGRRA